MLTKVTIRNFKRFGEAEVELGEVVVLIGPNNSGKTSALQALALWETGLRKWNERRRGKATPEKRPGVTINRRDLVASTVPAANLLWRELHTRDVRKVDGRQATRNVRIEVVVDGVTNDRTWTCGLEFDYANDESIYCRPLRVLRDGKQTLLDVPEEAASVRIAFLPSMSGLTPQETRLPPGAVTSRIGEGRTAEVLRNLCISVLDGPDGDAKWAAIVKEIHRLFGVQLDEPAYIQERGELAMTYREREALGLDISCAGRGLHQTLLLLSYMSANPGAVLLLDEPDAHLEVLRQRQIYELLTRVAREHGNQIIAASHSEVVLNEAASRDVVVAFVGSPHRIDDRDRGSQVGKALREIGFEDYHQAEIQGWVLYLEGSTDLEILRAFAATLGHPAAELLERPFVRYVANDYGQARKHFHGVREAHKDLVGTAIYDQLELSDKRHDSLRETTWARCEIENYLCMPEVLLAFARSDALEEEVGPLFAPSERQRRVDAMKECIEDAVPRKALRDPNDKWWLDTKASDDFLDGVFAAYFERLKLPNLMRKSGYHALSRLVKADQITPEVTEKLDLIVEVAKRAKPRRDGD